jgi:hypothetical protein
MLKTFPVPRIAIFMGVSFREQDPVWMVRAYLAHRQVEGRAAGRGEGDVTVGVPVCSDGISGCQK